MGRLLRIALTALLVSTHSSTAQQMSGRADLEQMVVLPPELVAARVAFTRSSAVCPDDHEVWQISSRWLRQHRVDVMRRTSLPIQSFKAIDDTTYLYRVATLECRFDLAIRQQIRQPDGLWQSLSVSRVRRPNLSPEERQEAIRQLQRDRPLKSPEETARWNQAFMARRSFGSLRQGLAGMSAGAVFEGAPAACTEAVGNLATDQDGVMFTFLTGLPGDLNRFVIERTDIDDDHGRLHFTRGDCRYEITIGASDFTNGAWVARPVAPYAPPKARVFIQKNPDTRPSWLDRSE